MSMRFSFHAEQWLPYPVPRVFAFFANPQNLPRLMPAWQHARIDWASYKASPRPPSADDLPPGETFAGEGSRLTLTFRPFPYSPVRIPWQAEITEFVWDDHFCDRQRNGPFAYWNHCHRVQAETRDSIPGTLVTDHVDYEPPFGIAGRIAHAFILRGQIAGAFAFRQRRLTELLAASRP